MSDSNRADNPPGLHAGRLEGISLPDLLWRFCERESTGVLQVEREGVRKTVYFEQGRIVFAASSDPDDRLGEQLLRQGAIGLKQLAQAISQLGHGKRLGTLLVEAGSLSPENLVQGVISQVKSMVLSLFTWDEGTFAFEEGPLPTDEVITLNMHTGEILFSGIRRIRSFSRIRRSVGAPSNVFAMREGWRDLVDPMNLSEPEELTIEQLDKGPQSVERLCRDVLLSNFEVYQTLWGLKVQGLIDEHDRQAERSDEATDQGSLKEQDFAEVLVRLCKSEQTGVLYVRARSVERSFHLDHGRCVFATSNDPDDGLLPYLLQRGVITLRDREETGKRLLSNKRVGTILLEMGVIDESDLKEMVRQQLSEIIFDTFSIKRGDYLFVPGELPTNEEITLDATLESLVVNGVRRITSWARVRSGCGDLDQPLELTRGFLDVLDGMDAGPEEWQVITALRSARTPDELCETLDVSTFRICQILWTLRVLGAIEAGQPRPVEQVVEAAAATEEDRQVEVEGLDEQPIAEQAEVEIEGLDEQPIAEQAEVEIEGLDEQPIAEQVEVEIEGLDEQPIAEQAEVEIEVEQLAEEAVAEQAEVEIEVEQLAEEAVAEQAEVEIEVEKLDEQPVAEQTEVEIEVEHAESSHAIDVEHEIEEPSPTETQVIRRADVEAAIQHEAPEPIMDEPAPDRAIDQESIEQTEEQPDVESGTSIWDLEQSSQTMRLSRDEVDAALGRSEEVSIEEAPEVEIISYEGIADDAPVIEEQSEDWTPPSDLDEIIQRFNAKHRVVYRTVRAEVGAGAANFIRACCGPETDQPEALSGAELQSDGSWDAESLRRAIHENRISDPRGEYERLISLEIEHLRSHIGETKIVELERQIENVDRAEA